MTDLTQSKHNVGQEYKGVSGYRDYYQLNGYVTIPGLIQVEKVDNLLKAYTEQILPSKAKFFRHNTDAMRPTA